MSTQQLVELCRQRAGECRRYEISPETAADAFDQLAAELERLERKPQWLPIESAPTDGTEFLAFSPNTGAVILTYLDSDHPDYDGDTPHVTWDHASFWSATHWMPLPAAPDIGEGEGK